VSDAVQTAPSNLVQPGYMPVHIRRRHCEHTFLQVAVPKEDNYDTLDVSDSVHTAPRNLALPVYMSVRIRWRHCEYTRHRVAVPKLHSKVDLSYVNVHKESILLGRRSPEQIPPAAKNGTGQSLIIELVVGRGLDFQHKTGRQSLWLEERRTALSVALQYWSLIRIGLPQAAITLIYCGIQAPTLLNAENFAWIRRL
jgi:hypothetical protein